MTDTQKLEKLVACIDKHYQQVDKRIQDINLNCAFTDAKLAQEFVKLVAVWQHLREIKEEMKSEIKFRT